MFKIGNIVVKIGSTKNSLRIVVLSHIVTKFRKNYYRLAFKVQMCALVSVRA